MIDKINVDIEMLISNKLKLEEYFILFCLVNNDEDLLVRYITECGTIDTNSFRKLRESGFIILTDEVNITFNSVKITAQTEKLFGSKNSIEFDLLFQEVLATYPSKVKRLTGGTRRLHNDLVRCKKNYRLTVVHNGVINLDLHKKIILCIQLYYREHLKDNKQEFMQLLATFLSQKTWEQYLSDLNNVTTLPQNNYDAI
jgi:hypothetical protein